MSYLGGVQVSGTHHAKTDSIFRYPNTYTFFLKGFKSRLKMMVSDLIIFQEELKVRLGSEWARHVPRVGSVQQTKMIAYDKITLGTSRNQ